MKMKNLFINITFIILSVLCWGCSDEDNKSSNLEFAVFVQEKLNIPFTAGEAVVLIEWSSASWEIDISEDKGIIKALSKTKGGSENDDRQYTQIKLLYNENLEEESREQKLTLRNLKTGQNSQLKIVQDSRYAPVTLTIDKSIRYQYIDGFGGMNIQSLWFDKSYLITEDEMAKMYSPNGLGYNIFHVMDAPNVWHEDMLRAKWAQDNGAIVFGTAGVPDSMIETKSDGTRYLNPNNYEAYQDHIIKYIDALELMGVDLYAVSLHNEPDMTHCKWTAQEYLDFLKNHTDKIREKGIRIMGPETAGFEPKYTDVIFNDPDAMNKIDIIIGHLYQGFMNTEESSYVKNRYEYIVNMYNKTLAPAGKGGWWMTEHLFNDGEKESDPNLWKFNEWHYNLETLGKEIHMCMDGYCSAYVYFYLKRFYGLIADPDPRSPVKSGEVTKNGYILSHYAKYASGKTRIKVETKNSNILATAYINEREDEMTLVMVNLSKNSFKILIPLSDIKDVTAVETTSFKNMENVTANNQDDGVSILLSENSINSVRLKL